MFSHVVGPPRSCGMTWSRFKSFRSKRPAVLARVFVALKYVVARELHFLLRQPVIDEQQNDARHANAEGNGADGSSAGVFSNVAPFLEAEGVNEPSGRWPPPAPGLETTG